MQNRSWFDVAAIGASAACLVHCLALPLLFAMLPAIALIIKVPETFTSAHSCLRCRRAHWRC